MDLRAFQSAVVFYGKFITKAPHFAFIAVLVINPIKKLPFLANLS